MCGITGILSITGRTLNVPEKTIHAMTSVLEHRGPDNVGTIRLRCAQKSPDCARESLPVHEHPLLLP